MCSAKILHPMARTSNTYTQDEVAFLGAHSLPPKHGCSGCSKRVRWGGGLSESLGLVCVIPLQQCECSALCVCPGDSSLISYLGFSMAMEELRRGLEGLHAKLNSTSDPLPAFKDWAKLALEEVEDRALLAELLFAQDRQENMLSFVDASFNKGQQGTLYHTTHHHTHTPLAPLGPPAPCPANNGSDSTFRALPAWITPPHAPPQPRRSHVEDT